MVVKKFLEWFLNYAVQCCEQLRIAAALLYIASYFVPFIDEQILSPVRLPYPDPFSALLSYDKEFPVLWFVKACPGWSALTRVLAIAPDP
jgi:hypothetical protein